MTLGIPHHDVLTKINKLMALSLPSVPSQIYTSTGDIPHCWELLWTYDAFSGPSPNYGT